MLQGLQHFTFFFFPLQAQSHRRTQEKEKKPAVFSLISRTWCRGNEGGGWETRQAPKNKQKQRKNKRKSKQNKHTHTENEHQLMN